MPCPNYGSMSGFASFPVNPSFRRKRAPFQGKCGDTDIRSFSKNSHRATLSLIPPLFINSRVTAIEPHFLLLTFWANSMGRGVLPFLHYGMAPSADLPEGRIPPDSLFEIYLFPCWDHEIFSPVPRLALCSMWRLVKGPGLLWKIRHIPGCLGGFLLLVILLYQIGF